MDKNTKILSPRLERRKKWYKERRQSDKTRVTRARTSEASLQKKPPQNDTPTISERGFKTKLSVTQINSSKSNNDKNVKKKLKRKHLDQDTGANLSKNNVKANAKNKVKKEAEEKVEDKTGKTTPKKAKIEIVDAVAKLENSTSIHIPKRYILFVGNLPDDITKEQVEEHFKKTGGVKAVRLPKEKGTDQPRGFAYVEFTSTISHRIALRLHNTTLCGKKIIVEFTSNGKMTKKQLESIKERDDTFKTLQMPFDT